MEILHEKKKKKLKKKKNKSPINYEVSKNITFEYIPKKKLDIAA